MGGVSWVMWCLRLLFDCFDIVICRGNNPRVDRCLCLEASFACVMLQAMSGCLESSVTCSGKDLGEFVGGRYAVGSAI